MNLHRTLAARILQLVLLAFLVTSATFFLSALTPGDFFTRLEASPSVSPETVDRLREQYGLHQPVHLRYLRWLSNSFRLDLGYSLSYGRPVAEVVGDALGNTFCLGIPALLLGLGAGIWLGSFHALRRESASGALMELASAMALSLPSLVLGLGALLFAAQSQWFPVGGMESLRAADAGTFGRLLDRLHHLVLPVACLTLPVLVSVERLQYASVSDTLDQPYVRSAISRGIGSARIFLHYLVRPSLNPVLSAAGPMLGAVLSGSLVLEWIFAWPGLGRITYDALFNRDVFLLLGCVGSSSILLVLGNLTADILLYLLDPRTRASAAGGRP